jgi:hypothetical protein
VASFNYPTVSGRRQAKRYNSRSESDTLRVLQPKDGYESAMSVQEKRRSIFELGRTI